MVKIAYFDCFAGISGDMILGALIDAGVDVALWKEELKKLPFSDTEYKINITKSEKKFMQGIHVDVVENKNNHDDNHSHNHYYGRHLKDLLKIIDDSSLSERVKKLSKGIFTKLAQAESKVHNTNIDMIHFHELSAIDTIIDVVGSLIAIELLGIEKVYSSPIPLGRGFIKTAHGMMPVPAPATIELLKNVPICSNDIEDEVTTPTGAAIISTICGRVGFMPSIKLLNIGYGAGKKDFSIPNLLRIMIGETIEEYKEKKQLIIETAIDDMNPQIYEYLTEKLFEVGVLDVFYTPIYMKKQRPATLVTILTEPYREDAVTEIIFKETTSIGYRKYFIEKVEMSKFIYTMNTPWGNVRIKKSNFKEILNITPEYEDCKIIAKTHGIPLKTIMKEIEKIISKSEMAKIQ